MGHDDSAQRARFVLVGYIAHVPQDLPNDARIRFSGFQLDYDGCAVSIPRKDVDKTRQDSTLCTVIDYGQSMLQSFNRPAQGPLHILFQRKFLTFSSTLVGQAGTVLPGNRFIAYRFFPSLAKKFGVKHYRAFQRCEPASKIALNHGFGWIWALPPLIFAGIDQLLDQVAQAAPRLDITKVFSISTLDRPDIRLPRSAGLL